MGTFSNNKLISNLRQDYKKSSMRRSEINDDPFIQFSAWINEAIDSDIVEPNAMVLGTSYKDKPSCRSVLLKSFDERGFVFFTNYLSNKAKEINLQSKVSILFPWYKIERQVIILGYADKISKEESNNYFKSRPRKSQLGAWVSQQSSTISSRTVLEEQMKKVNDQFKDIEIPIPDFWGGYRVKPNEFEFWQGRENRLHDRFHYKRKSINNEDKNWRIKRLSP